MSSYNHLHLQCHLFVLSSIKFFSSLFLESHFGIFAFCQLFYKKKTWKLLYFWKTWYFLSEFLQCGVNYYLQLLTQYFNFSAYSLLQVFVYLLYHGTIANMIKAFVCKFGGIVILSSIPRLSSIDSDLVETDRWIKIIYPKLPEDYLDQQIPEEEQKGQWLKHCDNNNY